MSEADTINRARQGEGAAWDVLVRHHQQAAFRLAYLIPGNADDAEDVAQEAFARAYQALKRFDAGRPFRPGLLSITANLVRNRRRSIGRYLAALRRLVKSEPEPRLTVTSRRLDGSAPPLVASRAKNGFHPALRSFMLTGLDIPAPGCWEIIGRYQGHETSFVVWVAP